MSIQDALLTELAPQPYATIRDRIRDGDVPLCSANGFGSRMIGWPTPSQWSHCAIAFRVRENGSPGMLGLLTQIGALRV